MRRVPILYLVALSLAACGDRSGPQQGNFAATDLELIDGQLVNGTDPLIMAALNDPIMIDPQLAAKSNADAIRPPGQPYADALPHPSVASGSNVPKDIQLLSTPAPEPLGRTAAHESLTLASLGSASGKTAARCAARLTYSADWARRLPSELELHPDARVVEAAGADNEGCALRIVSFHAERPVQHLLDWYYTRATRAGFTAGHRADGAMHVLTGSRARGGIEYALYLTDRGDGATDVDIVTTGTN